MKGECSISGATEVFKSSATPATGSRAIKGCLKGGVGKLKKAINGVKWADEVGRALTEGRLRGRAPNADSGKLLAILCNSGSEAVREVGTLERPCFIAGDDEAARDVEGGYSSHHGKASYK